MNILMEYYNSPCIDRAQNTPPKYLYDFFLEWKKKTNKPFFFELKLLKHQ